MSGIRIITDVATEPITRAEAKLHLGLDDIGGSHPDDSLVDALITQAREFAEHYTGRALAGKTLELALNAFPEAEDDWIDLPAPPVASITHIKYTDTAGAEQTLDAAYYALSVYGDARRVAPTAGQYWPATQDITDAVRIRYVTGYAATGAAAGNTALPKACRQGLLMDIALRYPRSAYTPAEREAMERARDSLLNTIRIWGRT